MKKTYKKLVQLAISSTMMMTAIIPFSRIITEETGWAITAYAADHTADMVANPDLYFEYRDDPMDSSKVIITRYKGTDGVIRIPGTIKGKKVSEISSHWKNRFIDNDIVRQKITKVTIDSNLSCIGSFAFDGCSNLEYVSIPYSVQCIQSNAFSRCTKLTEVVYSRFITEIGNSAFADCPNLETAKNANSAKTLLLGGATHLQWINKEELTRYCGAYQEPYLHPSIKSFFFENYDLLDGTWLLQDYERWYATYMVYGKLGIKWNMSDVQKASIIFKNMKQRVTYDNDAWCAQKVDGHVVGYGPKAGYNDSKAHVAGSALWGDKTVCEGYAKALSLLFSEAGLNTYMVSTKVNLDVYRNGQTVKEGVGHAFNAVCIDSKYYVVDATEDYNIGFMVSSEKHRQYRNTDPVASWTVSYYRGTTLTGAQCSYLCSCMRSELGDVDGDGRVTKNDFTVHSQYFKGTQAQKNAILNQYHRSKQEFESLSDVDGDGVLNSSKDSLALWNRYSYAQKQGLA